MLSGEKRMRIESAFISLVGSGVKKPTIRQISKKSGCSMIEVARYKREKGG